MRCSYSGDQTRLVPAAFQPVSHTAEPLFSTAWNISAHSRLAASQAGCNTTPSTHLTCVSVVTSVCVCVSLKEETGFQ